MATELVDAEYLKDFGGIGKNVSASRLTPHILRASRTVKRFVGVTKYQAALDISSTDEALDLKDAEACFAMAYVLPVLNMRTDDLGGVVQQQDFSPDGAGSSTEFLSPGEVASSVESWERQGNNLIKPYKLADSTGTKVHLTKVTCEQL